MISELAMRRLSCHRHLLNRAWQRGIPLSAQDVAALELTIGKMRPCFDQADRQRHRFRMQHAGERITVVFDSEVNAIVTVWRTYDGKRVETARGA